MPRAKVPAAALLDSPDEIEARFYEALQRGDIAALMAVWADDDEIVCVHPGGPRLVGASQIRESFEAIFQHGAIAVQPEQVHRLHALGAAVHHLAERVMVQGERGPEPAWVLATNVYVKTALGWRLAAHHASPGALAEAPTAGADGGPSTLH